MAKCLQCNDLLYRCAKNPVCYKCRMSAKCACGNRRDWRAEKCQKCDSARLSGAAKKQWREKREKMTASLIVAGVRRRKKFDDLEWKDFRERKAIDGRYFARYWDDAGVFRAVYRYQWVWIQANGAIPKGYHVHHKDGDPTNDTLGNLEILTPTDHLTHHKGDLPSVKWICQQCSKVFQRSRRGGMQPRKFCGQDCHYAYIRGRKKEELLCPTFQAADEYTRLGNIERGII